MKRVGAYLINVEISERGLNQEFVRLEGVDLKVG